jgi:hypothetical protein
MYRPGFDVTYQFPAVGQPHGDLFSIDCFQADTQLAAVGNKTRHLFDYAAFFVVR